jgi:hypothetical protein
MTVVTLDDVPRRRNATKRPRHPHINAASIAHTAKTLLGQALRMLLVASCFTAIGAAVIAMRLYAFMPALHH